MLLNICYQNESCPGMNNAWPTQTHRARLHWTVEINEGWEAGFRITPTRADLILTITLLLEISCILTTVVNTMNHHHIFLAFADCGVLWQNFYPTLSVPQVKRVFISPLFEMSDTFKQDWVFKLRNLVCYESRK